MIDFDQYTRLKTNAISIQATAKAKYQSAQNLKVEFDEATQKLENEKKSCLTQSVSIDTLKEIIDRLSQDSVKKVADLLTYGLSIIFFDKKYSVNIEVTDSRNNKTAELYLIEHKDDGKEIRSSFNDACGGGVLAVCGCILQVYFCNLLHQAPILFLDEMLSQLSTQYIDTFMGFINELADAKNLILVLVTHDERYKAYAKKTYYVKDGVYSEVKVSNG